MHHPFLVLLDAVVVGVVVYTAGHAAAGRAAGVTVEEVGLFVGPALLDFRVKGVRYRLGMIPVGGYVKFLGDDEKGGVPPGSFHRLHPLVRVAVMAAGPLAILALSAACLGPAHAARSFVHGFGQAAPFLAARGPGGGELLRGLSAVLTYGSFRTAVGVVAAKVAAMNLLPIPALVGGTIVTNLLGWRRGLPDGALTALNTAGLVVTLVLVGYWVVAVARFALGS